eukprot:CAMPEP_0168783570 /NCGR_PEP_ID=MMETSP0725-20121227/9764_1 /TAXON_ID=265536 /ORGANISM="Amphiprora sp., Strain CCMP467" /LENGTH=230 /DNA_ID=CAMNT_0008833571 /DNA_START=19 /DNA_END=711 /DNA_ORIENTATION=-
MTPTRRLPPMRLQALPLLLLLFAAPTLGFRSDALNRRGGGMIRTHKTPSQLTNQQQRQPSSPSRTLYSSTRTTSKTTTTQLRASVVQYKNVEQMLDSFRDEPLLIAFTAVNCGPCKLQRKELVNVQKDLNHHHPPPPTAAAASPPQNQNQQQQQQRITMVAIDTDRWPNVGSRFHVGKLPCLVAVQNGRELLRLEGLQSAQDITQQVRAVLQKPLVADATVSPSLQQRQP